MGLVTASGALTFSRKFQNAGLFPVNIPAVMNDLTFTGLVIGKKYRVVFSLFTSTVTDGGPIIRIYNGASQVGKCMFDTGTSGFASVSYSSIAIFTATSTSVTFEAQAFNTCNIEGDGTLARTNAVLTELPDSHVLTTNFLSVDTNIPVGPPVAIADLTFPGLIVGKSYRINLYFESAIDDNDGFQCIVYNGASSLLTMVLDATDGGGTLQVGFIGTHTFTATDTTLTTEVATGLLPNIIKGTNSFDGMYAILEEVVGVETVDFT